MRGKTFETFVRKKKETRASERMNGAQCPLIVYLDTACLCSLTEFNSGAKW